MPTLLHIECPTTFTAHNNQLTARSKVYNPNGPGPSEGARESNLRKHNIDLRTASFVELYRKKFQIRVIYPDFRLLFGIPFNRHPG
jgi:hypothetical protein